MRKRSQRDASQAKRARCPSAVPGAMRLGHILMSYPVPLVSTGLKGMADARQLPQSSPVVQEGSGCREAGDHPGPGQRWEVMIVNVPGQ